MRKRKLKRIYNIRAIITAENGNRALDMIAGIVRNHKTAKNNRGKRCRYKNYAQCRFHSFIPGHLSFLQTLSCLFRLLRISL